MRCFLTGLVLLAFCALNVTAQAQNEEAPLLMFRSVRAMSLGNAFEAIADDANALHYNPAGIAQNDSTLVDLLLFRPRFTYDLANERGELSDLVEAINDLSHSDNPLKDPEVRDARDTAIDAIERLMDEDLGAIGDLPSLNLTFPLTKIGETRLSLGLGAYTQYSVYADVIPHGLAWSDPVKAVLDDEVVYRAIAQWSLAAAISAEVPLSLPFLSRVYGGLSLRRINRQILSDEDDPFTVEDVLRDPEGFTETYFGYEDGDSVWDFIDKNFEEQKGYGTDLGLLVVPIDGLQIGLSIRNLTGKLTAQDTDEEFDLKTNVSLSAAAKPFELLNMDNSMLDLTVAVSLDNPDADDGLSQFTNNSLDKFHLGIEAALWPDAPLSLAGRIGSNQGFAAFGLGVRFGPLELQAARYGDLQSDWYVGSLGLTF